MLGRDFRQTRPHHNAKTLIPVLRLATRPLTSDATGLATWTNPTTIASNGDNLGDHTATAHLDMGTYNISNAGNITVSGTVNGLVFNGTTFNGGTFNGVFVGDASALANVSNADSANNADNSSLLDGYDSTDFLKSNGSDTFTTGTLTFASGTLVEDANLNGDTIIDNGNLTITTSTPTAGYVLTSDATGLATWTNPTTIASNGDNLGDHTATTHLDMGTYNISNTGNITASGTVNGIVFNGTTFNGGTFNGIFVGDGTGITGVSKYSFKTINTSSGTDPVADSNADTLNLTAGANITITGDASTDTITIAATGGGGTVAGASTQIQYHNGSDFGASANFTFDEATNIVTINGHTYIDNGDSDDPGLSFIGYNTGITSTSPSDTLDIIGGGVLIASMSSSSAGIYLASPTGIGAYPANTNEQLTVEGVIALDQLNTAPSATAGYGKIYMNGIDLFFKDGSGTETQLTSSGGEWTDAGTYLYPSDASGAETVIVGGATTGGADIVLGVNGNVIVNQQKVNVPIALEVHAQSQTNAFTVLGTGGQVGIGFTSPGAELEVNGTTISDDFYVREAGTASIPSFTYEADTDTGIFFPMGDTMGFTTGGSERARINTSGYFGIKTTNPSAHFNIAGGSSSNIDGYQDILVNGDIEAIDNMYAQKFTASSVFLSTPTDSPGTCNAGMKGGMYFDNSMSEPCFCDGSNWKQFDGGGNCT